MAEQIMAYAKCDGKYFALTTDTVTRVWSLRALVSSEEPDPVKLIKGIDLTKAIREGGGGIVLVLKNGEIELLNFEGNNVDFVVDKVPEYPTHTKFLSADFFLSLSQAVLIPYSPEKPGETAYVSTIKDERGKTCVVIYPATGHSSGVPIPADSNFRALMSWVLVAFLDIDNKSDKRIGYEEVLSWFINSDLGPKAEGWLDFLRRFFGLRQWNMSFLDKLRSKQSVSTENMQELFKQLAKRTGEFPDVEDYVAERKALLQKEIENVADNRRKAGQPNISQIKLDQAKSRVGRNSVRGKNHGYSLAAIDAARDVFEAHGMYYEDDQQIADKLYLLGITNIDS